MLPSIRALIVCFISILLSMPSFAAVVEGLYEGTVPVADQSSRSQQRGITDALKQVLVKVSGNEAILHHDQIKQQLKNSRSLLTAYRFDINDNILSLNAQFDAQRVDSMILASGFSIWGARRPDILMWIALEDPETSERSLLEESSGHPVVNTIKTFARQRGLPVSMPLYDLTDIQRVGIYDVWGQFSTTIAQASLRYDPDYIVSARIYFRDDTESEDNTAQQADDVSDYEQSDEARFNSQSLFDNDAQAQSGAPTGWVVDYIMDSGDQMDVNTISADDPVLVTEMLMNILADTLAKKYAIDFAARGTTDNRVNITLTNLDSLEKYVKVVEFLSSLSMVEHAELVEQHGFHGTFELKLIGDESDLRNAFKLDDKIRPVLDAFGQESTDLKFVWVP